MAWGCLTTNLAFPGFGSLLAGRRVGYFQIPFTIIGQIMSLVGTVPAFAWSIANFSRFQEEEDPIEPFRQMWIHWHWPIIGLAIFFFGLLWAWFTSRSILAEARAKEAMRPLPPKLNR
jgi:hypothetical protein